MSLDLGVSACALIVGYGLHGQAVAAALRAHDVDIIVIDDRPGAEACAAAADAGVDLIVAPADDALREAADAATFIVPTPGLPDAHRAFELARELGLPVVSEFDLAAIWDERPVVAITGTNGKTTVTTMVTEMLVRSGQRAVMAGNTDIPLVTAIAEPETELFVVEASSFRLGHSGSFRPSVATWLNFDPDHLDVHSSLAAYEAAKARIWAGQGSGDVAIANAEDSVVMRNLVGPAQHRTFGIGSGDDCVRDGWLWVGGAALIEVSRLARSLPHDQSNALAAAATALAAGADRAAVVETLETFGGLAHRVELVGEHSGIQWYNDSKATTPHAVVAGVGGFASAVLIAGGRNKGVDLAPLGTLAGRVHAVVAIGDAAAEIHGAFVDGPPVRTAATMAEAVMLAAGLARPGDAVVLSPGCTSYDWYRSYVHRGEDFARLVHELILGDASADAATPSEGSAR